MQQSFFNPDRWKAELRGAKTADESDPVKSERGKLEGTGTAALFLRRALQDETDTPGFGVLQHIRQPFLHDAVQGGLDRWRQALALHIDAVEIHFDPRARTTAPYS